MQPVEPQVPTTTPEITPMPTPVVAPFPSPSPSPSEFAQQPVQPAQSLAAQPLVEGRQSQGPVKSQLVALLLAIFLGTLGIDRFYLGSIGLGVLKLLTGGVFGVLWIVDIILIATKKYKGVTWE